MSRRNGIPVDKRTNLSCLFTLFFNFHFSLCIDLFSRHLLQSIHLLPLPLCIKKTSGWNLSGINGLNHTIDDKLKFQRTYVFPSKSANKGKQKRLILLITYSAGNL